MPDDFSANINTTGVYSTIGSFSLGANEVNGDEDWFRVPFFQQHYTYDIKISGNTFGGNTRKTSARYAMYNASGAVIDGGVYNYGLLHTRVYTHNAAPAVQFIGIGGSVGGYRLEINYRDVGNSIADASDLGLDKKSFVASAIETSGDIDFYEHKLRAGVEYEINLLANASRIDRGTTLTQAGFDLYGPGGARATGLNIDGSNRRITFTPTVTGSHFLRVRANGGATGSYIVESDQFDDYSGSIDTTGVLVADGSTVTGVGEYALDKDWFRVELELGYTYEFAASETMTLHDSTGERLFWSSDYGSPLRRFSVPVDSSGTYFVGIVSDSEFALTGNIVDDFTPGTPTNRFGSVSTDAFGVLETAGDSDRFYMTLVAWGAYTFSPRGVTEDALANPRLDIFESNSRELIQSGTGPFTFKTNDAMYGGTQRYYVDVSSAGGTDTGVYQFGFRASDNASGDASTKWTVNLNSGSARIRNAFETTVDVDWHRINMMVGTTYEISGRADLSQYSIVQPDGTVRTITDVYQRFFDATQDGTHYLVADAADLPGFRSSRSFEFRITEGAIPQSRSGALFTGARISTIARQTSFGGYANLEVYADTDLQYLDDGNYVRLTAGELKTFSLGQYRSLTLVDDFEEIGEVFVRGVSPAGLNHSHSPWAAVALYPVPYPTDVAPPESNKPISPISYAFANSLPTYLAGNPDYTGFQTLSVDERLSMKSAINRWNISKSYARFNHITPGANNSDAQVMIFKAAIDSDVQAFRLGDELGADLAGDIVINTNSILMSDLSEGKQGFFELLRGAGIVLGLNEVTSRTRDESVMGDRTVGVMPFSSYPTPIDIRAVRFEFQDYFHSDDEVTVYSLTEADPFLRTMIDSGDTISAEGQTKRVNIDLRPGKASYVGVSLADSPNTYVNSYYSRPHNAIGGNFSDALFGNEYYNELRGGRGNDILVGGVGNDSLFGGANNDYYIIKPGHGNNAIDEEGAGGRDTIRFEGLHNMTGTQDDLTLQRLGNDLIIRLEYDGKLNKNTDTITIKNMSDPNSRVESLALFNNEGFVERINLVSAFKGADESRGRFKLAPSANGFGRIVTPV